MIKGYRLKPPSCIKGKFSRWKVITGLGSTQFIIRIKRPYRGVSILFMKR